MPGKLYRYRLEILAIVTFLVFGLLFVYAGSFGSDSKFSGSDTQGAARVAEITGKHEEDFPPLIGQWSPPGKEIESGLFALQAAVGGIMVGLVFGYWMAQKNVKS